MDDEELFARFADATASADTFTHRAHIRVAWLHLRRYSFDEVVERLRQRLRALTVALGVPDLPTRGYHETITIAWLRLVDAAIRDHGPCGDSNAFCDRHPELMTRDALAAHYTRDHLFSPAAKGSFVEPDLAPLPG